VVLAVSAVVFAASVVELSIVSVVFYSTTGSVVAFYVSFIVVFVSTNSVVFVLFVSLAMAAVSFTALVSFTIAVSFTELV
jgi:hypothetical protein